MKNKFKRTFGGSRGCVSARVPGRKVSAVAWMSQLSAAGRLAELPPAKPETPKTLVVEQWVAGKWVSRKLVWDGRSYVPGYTCECCGKLCDDLESFELHSCQWERPL